MCGACVFSRTPMRPALMQSAGRREAAQRKTTAGNGWWQFSLGRASFLCPCIGVFVLCLVLMAVWRDSNCPFCAHVSAACPATPPAHTGAALFLLCGAARSPAAEWNGMTRPLGRKHGRRTCNGCCSDVVNAGLNASMLLHTWRAAPTVWCELSKTCSRAIVLTAPATRCCSPLRQAAELVCLSLVCTNRLFR